MRTQLFVTVVSLLALTTAAKAQNQAVLEMPDLGLAMSHPKVWQITQLKKTNDLKVLIPIEGSSQKAVLELYNIGFNSDKDVWQLGQKAINDRMKREVMRQWEEEFLGVPMLLTKVSFVDKDGPQILLTGLIYSRTSKKLMFRLAAAPDDYDKAEFAWRETMNTIRTGQTWAPEDPSLKPDPKGPVKTPMPRPAITSPKSLDGEVKLSKPPVAIEISIAGRKVELRIPGEWAGKVEDDGSVTLTNPEVSGAVKIVLASSLDSDPPQKALMAASSKTLETYQKVSKRDESIPTKNKAGALVAAVWRTGTMAQGDLFTCDAATANGDFYFLTSYKSQNASKVGAERRHVEALLLNSTIQIVP